jgi:hypothetical protein
MQSPLLTVIRSLSLHQDRRHELRKIGDAEWRKLLALTDRSQLTLPLGVRCGRELPVWVQERIGENLEHNAIRHARIVDAYKEVAGALSGKRIDFVVLKGLTHWPLYCDDLRHRPQYDLDLYCPAHAVMPAYQAIQALGYEPFGKAGAVAVDHLPPMIRMTGWRPRGDYYDPDMPLTIELHFRLWDASTERFHTGGESAFWERRIHREVAGVRMPTLGAADGLSYACWHLVRHLVRGDLRAYHVYELAWFLQHTAEDDPFWHFWRKTRPSPLVEAIAFRLAVEWFECTMNPIAREICQELPSSVRRWFDLFAFSPATTLERPNKDELFLHLCLLDNHSDRLSVAKRRLFPFRFNPVVVDAHVPSPDRRLRMKRRISGAWFMARRALHHARAFAPVMWSAFRWQRALAK